MPAMAAESHGMEDARFVRFADDDGTATYYATYTAYDGTDIAQQLLGDDGLLRASRRRRSSARRQPTRVWPSFPGGSAAATPRCRARTERPTPSPTRTTCGTGRTRVPARCRPGPGRCSSSATAARRSRPRPAGWSSPTESVPCAPTTSARCCSTWRIRPGSSASCNEPLLSPAADEQDGYVPNVVYSCGAMVHAG